MRLAAASLLLAAGLAGTPLVFPSDSSAADVLDDAFTTMTDAERAFAQASKQHGVRAAFLEFLDDDAIGFEPSLGRAKAAWRARPVPADPLATTLSWQPRAGDVAASGDLGWLTGPYVLRTQRRRVAHGVRLLLLNLDSPWRRALARAHRRWCFDLRAVRLRRRWDRAPRVRGGSAARGDGSREQELVARPGSIARHARGRGRPGGRLRIAAASGCALQSRREAASGGFRGGHRIPEIPAGELDVRPARRRRRQIGRPRVHLRRVPIRRRTSGRRRLGTTCGCGGGPPRGGRSRSTRSFQKDRRARQPPTPNCQLPNPPS